MRAFLDHEANLAVRRYVTAAGSTDLATWSVLYGMQPDSRAILDFDAFRTPSFYLDTLRQLGYDIYWCMTGALGVCLDVFRILSAFFSLARLCSIGGCMEGEWSM